MAIGKRVKSENNGLGSPIQLCVWEPAKGVLSFFAPEPLMLGGLIFRPCSPG